MEGKKERQIEMDVINKEEGVRRYRYIYISMIRERQIDRLDRQIRLDRLIN